LFSLEYLSTSYAEQLELPPPNSSTTLTMPGSLTAKTAILLHFMGSLSTRFWPAGSIAQVSLLATGSCPTHQYILTGVIMRTGPLAKVGVVWLVEPADNEYAAMITYLLAA
jgi:hypothetical protein